MNPLTGPRSSGTICRPILRGSVRRYLAPAPPIGRPSRTEGSLGGIILPAAEVGELILKRKTGGGELFARPLPALRKHTLTKSYGQVTPAGGT